MRIPEACVCPGPLPETECLVLFPGAVKGAVADPAVSLLSAPDKLPGPGQPVCEIDLPDVPARHVLAAGAEALDSPAGMEMLRRRLGEAVAYADGLGVGEISFLSLSVDTRDSRLFSYMTVFFRVLMQDRERHPCLGRIRFFCPTVADAEWIVRVYNFYYPADKSERMLISE